MAFAGLGLSTGLAGVFRVGTLHRTALSLAGVTAPFPIGRAIAAAGSGAALMSVRQAASEAAANGRGSSSPCKSIGGNQ